MTEGRLSDIDRYMTLGLGAAKRAASLTHRLLAFSRRQTLEPKPVDLNRLVSGMEERVRRAVGPQIDVEVVAGVALWTVPADRHGDGTRAVDDPRLREASVRHMSANKSAFPSISTPSRDG